MPQINLKKDDVRAMAHYFAAFAGGFLGIFPLLSRAGVFGSAQTVNLIEWIFSFLRLDSKGVFFHGIGVFLYAFAVFLATIINRRCKIDLRYFSIFIDGAAAFVMWKMPEVLPENVSGVVYLYPNFFAMAFQWCAFGGAYGFVSSTIFSTNNLRQAVSSFTEVFCNGKREFMLKAKFFSITILFFHIGVAFSFVLNRFFGNSAFLFVFLPLTAVFFTVRKENGIEN